MSNPLVGMATLTFVVALGAAGCEPSASSTADVTNCVVDRVTEQHRPAHGVVLGSCARSANGTRPGIRETLVAVVDGDTIETSAGTVRLVGIDAPEHGECALRGIDDDRAPSCCLAMRSCSSCRSVRTTETSTTA